VEDALDKLQDCLDRAAESIIPAKPDPEKAKEMAKRQALVALEFPVTFSTRRLCIMVKIFEDGTRKLQKNTLAMFLSGRKTIFNINVMIANSAEVALQATQNACANARKRFGEIRGSST
jgi:hypothetical protein